MARKIKCYGEECVANNIKHLPDELTKIDGKNYCEKCRKVFELEKKDRESLYKLIGELYGVDTNNPHLDYDARQLMAHAKKLRSDGLKYKGIEFTLRYIKSNVPTIKFDVRYGLGIVGRYYTTARKAYVERIKIQELQKQASVKKEVEVKIVKAMDSTNVLKEERRVDMDVLAETLNNGVKTEFDLKDIQSSII